MGRELSPELNAAIILFYSLLDEQQRRLYAGLESLRLGRGGDRQLADFLDLDPTPWPADASSYSLRTWKWTGTQSVVGASR